MERYLENLTRREFLQRASRTVAGTAAALALGAEVAEAEPAIDRLRTLGRTGLKVTTISFGGIMIEERRVLDVVIDQGINLVHTAPAYRGGKSIVAFGEVMKDKAKRDKVVLACKVKPDGIDAALQALNTDHIDIAIPDHGRIAGAPFPDDALREQYDAAKKAGKIRFTGFATHQNMASVVQAHTATGYFDVMLVAYNHGNRDQLNAAIREAREKHNTGFMVMKASKGLSGEQLGDGQLFGAAMKDLLADRTTDTILLGMGTYQHVQQNAALMGQRLTRREKERLEAHLRRKVAGVCALCGACDGVCPKGIAVADIMRCETYVERGDLDVARDVYHSLPAAATAAGCTDCGACTRSCSKRLNVAGRVRQVHAALA